MIWDGRRVPVTLIGGYLGAGKTTLVNGLLARADGRRLFVIVNDIGSVNVDASLIADHDGRTMTLTNGCVCCAIGDDLGMTFESIRGELDPPDQVVIELSGVAEPQRVAPWASTAGFRLDAIVVVADAAELITRLGDDRVGDSVRAQLASADLVVVSKLDLASPAEIDATRVAAAAITTAPQVEAADGRVDIDVVLGARHVDHPPSESRATPIAHRVETVQLGRPTRGDVEGAVAGLGSDVIRAKGLIACRDLPHPVEIQVVGARRTIRPRPDLPLDRGGTELVVIRPPSSPP